MRKIVLVALMGLLMFQVSPAADVVGDSNLVLVSDMITEVYYEVAAYTTTPYKIADTTFVINRLNWGAKTVAQDFMAVERDTTITVVAGTENYAVPSDFMAIRWVGAKPTGTNLETGMKLIAGNEVGAHRDAKGIPRFYLENKRQIHVEPTNTSGDSIIVHYAAYSNVLDATTDSTNLDRTYETLIVLRASESILRGKQPQQGTIQKALLDDITARKVEEERKLGLQAQSELEIITQ